MNNFDRAESLFIQWGVGVCEDVTCSGSTEWFYFS